MTADRLILDRLQFAKYVLASARRELASGTDFGAWQAVLQLHDATDTLLLCVMDHLGIPRKYRGLTEYAGEIESYRKKHAPDVPSLQHAQILRELNDLRDGTKHRGIYPRPQHVREVSSRLDTFFEGNARQYFGLAFSELSLADMIKDPIVRAHVKLAEDHLAHDRYSDTTRELGVAFAELRSREQVRLADLAEHIGDLLPPGLAEQGEAVVATLGLNLVQYATFRRLIPIIHLHEGGEPTIYRRPGEELLHTAETSNFCLEFVLEAVGRAQAAPRIPGVNAPRAIRAIRDTSYYQYPEITKPAGTVLRDTVVQNAHFALGPAHFGAENAWNWTPPGEEMRFARFGDFIVVEDRGMH
ncbi:MAG: hypothetical protein WD690_06090 [Vicinamibacterales bacterium]